MSSPTKKYDFNGKVVLITGMKLYINKMYLFIFFIDKNQQDQARALELQSQLN